MGPLGMVRVPPLRLGWVIRLGIGFHSVSIFFFKLFVFCSMFFRSAKISSSSPASTSTIFRNTAIHRNHRLLGVLPLSCAKFNCMINHASLDSASAVKSEVIHRKVQPDFN